jgi:hypothetical protein
MSDGIDLSRRLAHGHMPREQAAAHARLASLPTRRVVRAERDASEIARAKAELAERLRRARLDNGNTFNHAPQTFGQGQKRGAQHPAMSGRPQREAILEALRAGPMSAHDIAQTFQCRRATARIADLRDMGHEIVTSRVTTAEGAVTVYRLIKEAKR